MKAVPFGMVSLMLLLLSASGASVGGEGASLPDLEVKELTVVPGADGFRVLLTVLNSGGAPSKAVHLSVWDEYDLPTGEEELVVSIQLPVISPGEREGENIAWSPSVGGIHRIWAVIDADGVQKESARSNNVDFELVEMPAFATVTAEPDGDPDPLVMGTYLFGISLDVLVNARFGDWNDGGLYTVHFRIDGGPPNPSTSSGDGSHYFHFDAGELSPGQHELTVNATYAGVEIPVANRTIMVSDVPFWFTRSEDLEMRFDTDMGAYVVSGRMDVPTLDHWPEVQNISFVRPLRLFTSRSELSAFQYTQLDGTSEQYFECDVEIEGPDPPLSVHLEGFSHNTPGTGFDSFEGAIARDVDLSPLMGPAIFGMQGPNASAMEVLMHPMARVEVQVRLDIGLEGFLYPWGEFLLHNPYVRPRYGEYFNVDISVTGHDERLARTQVPGHDDPLFLHSMEFNWESHHGAWERFGSEDLPFIPSEPYFQFSSEQHYARQSPVLETRVYDLGIGADSSSEWNLSTVQGIEVMLGEWPDGRPAGVESRIQGDNMSSIIFWDGALADEVWAGDGYVSNPDMSFFSDGRPFVVWAQAENLTEDPLSRGASLGLHISEGDLTGGNFSPPVRMFNGSCDRSPVLSDPSNDGSVALIWLRDLDHDLCTTTDTILMLSVNTDLLWSLPVRLTQEGDKPVHHSCSCLDDGRVLVTWIDVAGAVRTIVVDPSSEVQGNGWELGLPEGTWASYAALSRGSSGELLLVYVRNGTMEEEPSLLCMRGYSSELVPPFSDEEVVRSSGDWMESPCIRMLSDGSPAVMWREWDGSDGELFVSRRKGDGLGDGWTLPLRLRDDSSVEVSFSFVEDAGGDLWIGEASLAPTAGEVQEPAVHITLRNLTWAADIVSMQVSAQTGYVPGMNASVSIDVMNRGLHPLGSAWIDLERVTIDPLSGRATNITVSLVKVTFTGIEDVQTVIVQVPIGELQLGYLASVEGPLGDYPAHNSTVFRGLPAIPDPVIKDLRREGPVSEDGNASIRVLLKNMGSMRAVSRVLTVMRRAGLAPMAFNGSLLEPLFLRSTDQGEAMENLTVTLDPGSEVSYLMDVPLRNGTNVLWVELLGYGWNNGPVTFGRPVVVHRLSLLELSSVPERVIAGNASTIDLSFEARNTGRSGGLDRTELIEEKGEYDISAPIDLSYFFEYSITNGTSILLEGRTVVTDVPPPGSTVRLDLTVPGGSLSPGTYRAEVRVVSPAQMLEGGPDWSFASFTIIITHGGRISIEEIEPGKLSDLGKGLYVHVLNSSPRTMRASLVVLYNGLPRDGVVISDGLSLSLKAWERGSLFMPLGLAEGSYLLTISIMAPPSWGVDGFDDLTATTSYTFEYNITKEAEPPDESPSPSQEDILPAVVMGCAAIFFVIAGAMLFRKDEDRDMKRP